ncbi:hypothetical protein B0F87_101609 [Methylobacter tundripaludum]|uniref:Uncharacterized protein n=1 Tax=Methylobacter tundripaludum TaxID=173365 RepID=A0A2S6HLE0_9GAMM|nr:hypothetical protein [Methylobacter tundripaludum]PPK78227.1 hypothetical protein B0F87_101609 [Methylobacter tundripaludum]
MQNPLDRIDDRTAEQLQKERSKSFESLMNKTKKSAELLGFIDAFFRLIYLLANTAILKLSASVPGISGVKMFCTAR